MRNPVLRPVSFTCARVPLTGENADASVFMIESLTMLDCSMSQEGILCGYGSCTELGAFGVVNLHRARRGVTGESGEDFIAPSRLCDPCGPV